MKLGKLRKSLAVLMSAAMVFSCVPATAMAEQIDVVSESVEFGGSEDDVAVEAEAANEEATSSGAAQDEQVASDALDEGDDAVEKALSTEPTLPTGEAFSDAEFEEANDSEDIEVSGVEEEDVEEATEEEIEAADVKEEDVVGFDSVSGNKTVAEGTYDLGENIYADAAAIAANIPGVVVTGGTRNGEQHGYQIGNGNSVSFNMASKGTITILGCTFGSYAKSGWTDKTKAPFTVDGKGKVSAEVVSNSDDGATSGKFTIDDAEGIVTLNFTTTEYLHKFSVEYNVIEEGTYDLGKAVYANAEAIETNISGVTVTGGKRNGEQHGYEIGNGNKISFSMANKGTITILGCTYGSYAKEDWTDKTKAPFEIEGKADVKAEVVDNSDDSGKKSGKFTLSNAEGLVTLTFNATEYIHQFSVEYGTVIEGKYDLGDAKYTDAATISSSIRGVTVTGGTRNGEQHGYQIGNGESISFNMAKKGTITILGCTFGSYAKSGWTDKTKAPFTVDGKGKVSAEVVSNSDDGATSGKFTIVAEKGPLTLKFTTTEYIHEFSVKYEGAEVAVGDAYIAKSFGEKVVINKTAGLKAHIFKASDDKEVDSVSANGESMYMGNSSTSGKVGLNKVGDNLIWTDGETLVITPHNDKDGYSLLEAGEEYYVTLDEGLVTADGAAVKVKKGDWTFKATAAEGLTETRLITVGSVSGNDFNTLTGAFNYLRKNGAKGNWTIYVDKGVYHERPFYYGEANITIIGDSEEGSQGNDVRFTWKNVNDWTDGGARGRSTFLVQGKGDMNMIGISMVNTFDRTADNGGSAAQAETLAFDGSGKLFVYDCGFYSHQDTLYIGKAGNRSWFYKSFIEGDVDFLWGYPGVCLFEDCELKCVYDPARAGNASAHLIASRTQMEDAANAGANKGFVLMDSTIYIDHDVTVNYARNSGSDTNAAIFNNEFIPVGENAVVSDKLYGSAPTMKVKDENGDLVVGYMDGENTFVGDPENTIGGDPIDTSDRLEGCGALVPRMQNREYSGRYVILNRGYNLKTQKFETAKEIWDVDDLAGDLGLSVFPDYSNEQIFVEPVAKRNVIGGVSVNYVAYDVNGTNITDKVEWSISENDAKDPSATGNTSAVDAAFDEAVPGKLNTKLLTRSTIEVKATLGGFSDVGYCYVIPRYVPADTLQLQLESGYMNLYGTKDLMGVLSCSTNDQDEVTSKKVTWTSEAPDKVLLYDPESKTFAKSVTTENCNVTVYAAGSGKATIKAETTDGGEDSVEINVYDDQMEWNPFVAGVLVNTDVQTGKWGTFNGMFIDAVTNNKFVNTYNATAKTGMKAGNTSMQTRNVIMNIPAEKDATLAITLKAAPTVLATADNVDTYNYEGLYADGQNIKWDADALAYIVNVNAAEAKAASITSPSGSTANVGSDKDGKYPDNLVIDKGIDSAELAKEQYLQLKFGSKDVYVMSYVLTQKGHEDKEDVEDDSFQAPTYKIAITVDGELYTDELEVSGNDIKIDYTSDGTKVTGTVGDVPFEVVMPEGRVVASITPEPGTKVTDDTEIKITTKEKEVIDLSTITEKAEFLTEDFYTAAVAADKMDETILSKDGKIVFVSSKKASGAVKSKVDVDTAAQSFADEDDKIAMLDETTEETHSAAVNLQASLFATGDTPAYFEFTTDKAGLLKVYWKSSSGSDPKTIGLRKVDKDGKTVGSATEGIAGVDDITGGLARAFSTEDTAKKYQWINTFFIPEAGTYRFGATSGGGKVYRLIVDLTADVSDYVVYEAVATNKDGSANEDVEITPAAAKKNAIVTIAAKKGKQFDSAPVVTDVSGNAVEVKDNGDGTYSFTMPAGGLKSIVVETSEVEVVIDVQDETGKETKDVVVEAGKADGEDVIFIKPAEGKKFDAAPVVTIDGKAVKVYGPDADGNYYIKNENGGTNIVVKAKTSDVKQGGGDTPTPDPEKETDPKKVAEDARNAGRGSIAGNEAVVVAAGKGFALDLDASIKAAGISANEISANGISLTLTLNKGDKVTLPGYAKKTSSLSVDKKLVAVSGKGVLKAKKETAGTMLSYVQSGSNTKININVVVKTPAISIKAVSANSVSGNGAANCTIKKLAVQATGTGAFDVHINAPLTLKVVAGKAKVKGGVTFTDSTNFVTVDENGELHITGTVSGKGTATIPLTVYGKKYTVKVKAK